MFQRYHMNTKNYGEISIQSLTHRVGEHEGFYDYLPFAYSQGITEVNSVLNLKALGNTLMMTAGSDEGFALIHVEEDLEYYSSDTYKRGLQLFNASTRFIWGSVEEGGLFLTKFDGNLMWGMCYGFYHNTTTDKYTYIIGMDASCRLLPNALSEVAICTNEDITDQYFKPAFYILNNNNVTASGDFRYWFVDTNSTLSPVYQIYYGSMVAGMSNPKWTDDWSITDPFTFNAVPVQPFYPYTDGTYIPYATISWMKPSNYEHISGSWDAGMSFDPEENSGDGEEGGGNGKYPTDNDNMPTYDPTGGTDLLTSGLIKMYTPTTSEVNAFQSFLFGNTITEQIANQMKRLTSNPYDYLIFLALCNFNPSTSQDHEVIAFCGQSSGVASRIVNQQMIRIGPYELNVEQSGFDFTDFNPYTRLRMFIPYIGYQDISPDDVMGAHLELWYNIDLMTGSCVATLHVKRSKRDWMYVDNAVDNPLYTWTGNVYMMCPLSSNDFRGFFSSMVQFANGVGSFATGNMIGGLGSMATAVMSQKSTVTKNVPSSSSMGMLNDQIPYLIYERPCPQQPRIEDYRAWHGIPLNKLMYVKDLNGYVECDPKTFWGTSITYEYDGTEISATDSEIAEIKQMFESGVMVNV